MHYCLAYAKLICIYATICAHILPSPVFTNRKGKRLLFCASVQYIHKKKLQLRGKCTVSFLVFTARCKVLVTVVFRIEVISTSAKLALNCMGNTGFLQLLRTSPKNTRTAVFLCGIKELLWYCRNHTLVTVALKTFDLGMYCTYLLLKIALTTTKISLLILNMNPAGVSLTP